MRSWPRFGSDLRTGCMQAHACASYSLMKMIWPSSETTLAVPCALSARFALQGGATTVMPIEALYDSLVVAQIVHHRRPRRAAKIRQPLGAAPTGMHRSIYPTPQAVTIALIVWNQATAAWHH